MSYSDQDQPPEGGRFDYGDAPQGLEDEFWGGRRGGSGRRWRRGRGRGDESPRGVADDLAGDQWGGGSARTRTADRRDRPPGAARDRAPRGPSGPDRLDRRRGGVRRRSWTSGDRDRPGPGACRAARPSPGR